MSVRCKFKCESVSPVFLDQPADPTRRASLVPVLDPIPADNLRPPRIFGIGGIDVVVSDPAALAQLKAGAFYYLDLVPVD